jgi:hypothetical protein
VSVRDDEDSSGPRRKTALMTAAWNGKADVCAYLLRAKANVDAKDEYGETALTIATHEANTADAVSVLRAWLKDRAAARAFARGTMHARHAHKKGDWTDSKLFDKNIIGEITAFVTPPPAPRCNNNKAATIKAAKA